MRIYRAIFFIILVFAGLAEAGLPRSRSVNGEAMVPLRTLGRYYGVRRSIDESKEVWDRGRDQLVFEVNSRRLLVNGGVVWLHEPVRRSRWNWWLSEVDVQTVIDPLMRPQVYLKGVGGGRVLLDAGHGGIDPGGQSPSGLLEKHLTLDLSRRVAQALETAGYEAVISRVGDETLSLADRVAMAESVEADLLVSIHFNTAANPDAQGAETFVLAAGGKRGTNEPERPGVAPATDANRFDGAQMFLGYLVHHSLLESTRATDRGLRRSRFFVLREARVPSILVECAFLTNEAEASLLQTNAYREQLARGIADGIIRYLQWVRRTQVELFNE